MKFYVYFFFQILFRNLRTKVPVAYFSLVLTYYFMSSLRVKYAIFVRKNRENAAVSPGDVTNTDSRLKRIGKTHSGSRNSRFGVYNFF